MTSYFCDGLKEVSVLNGVVRLEFHRLQETRLRGAGDALEPVTVLRIALTPNGLAQTRGLLEQVYDRLVQDGILERPSEHMNQSPEASQRKSPNFS